MGDYLEWRRLEREFRDFQERHPNLYAAWSSQDGQWTGFGGPEGEEDRFRALLGLAAATAGHSSGENTTAYLLNLVKEYLLKGESKNVSIGQHAWVPSPSSGSAGGSLPPGSTEPIVQHGEIVIIRPLCKAAADYCLERERQERSAQGVIPVKKSGGSSTRGSSKTGSPRAQRWEDVRISFLSDERIQVWIANQPTTYNYDEFGCADRRSGRPVRTWLLLRTLARAQGVIPANARLTQSTWPAIEKQVQRLRKVLQCHFNLQEDPLPFERGTGYRLRCKIGIAASFEK